VRYWIGEVLLVAGIAGVAVLPGQQNQAPAHEGVQQHGYQNMTPAQRAEATREFLGLGAVPDKVAAARGEPLFVRNCAFCHGQEARGATGPSLITSNLVLEDDNGEHLTPFLKRGRPEKGMPAFATMSDQQLTDIAEYLHLQVEDVANRGAYRVLNILVGNAAKGRAYVESHCMGCHSEETFAHIAGRFRSADQLQCYWIWPARNSEVTAIVNTPGGTVTGRLVQISDFRITLVNGSGETLILHRGPSVKVYINEPLAAHQKMLMTLSNVDMHNVTAYLGMQK